MSFFGKSSSDHMSGNQTGFVWLRVMGKVFLNGGDSEGGNGPGAGGGERRLDLIFIIGRIVALKWFAAARCVVGLWLTAGLTTTWLFLPSRIGVLGGSEGKRMIPFAMAEDSLHRMWLVGG